MQNYKKVLDLASFFPKIFLFLTFFKRFGLFQSFFPRFFAVSAILVHGEGQI
jgi:hypothetical protein